MINKLIKKIWFICLWLASLALAGCFHVPDEDWLLSCDKAETWDVKNDEMDEALNSLMDWINMISSDWNEMKNEENDEITADDEEVEEVENESINNEEIIDNEETNEEVEDEVIEDNTVSE